MINYDGKKDTKKVRKKETDPTKLRTFYISMYVKDQSENLYNYSMFAIIVFEKSKNEIDKEIYHLMKYTAYFRNIENLEEYLYELIDKYYDQYSENYKLMKKNNNAIYKSTS